MEKPGILSTAKERRAWDRAEYRKRMKAQRSKFQKSKWAERYSRNGPVIIIKE